MRRSRSLGARGLDANVTPIDDLEETHAARGRCESGAVHDDGLSLKAPECRELAIVRAGHVDRDLLVVEASPDLDRATWRRSVCCLLNRPPGLLERTGPCVVALGRDIVELLSRRGRGERHRNQQQPAPSQPSLPQ